MQTKNSWKNLAVTIRVLAGPGAGSKSVVFGVGLYDGSRRNHFFQRITIIFERYSSIVRVAFAARGRDPAS
jgi:hypothetical protein